MSRSRLLLPAVFAGALLAACDGEPEMASLPPPEEPGLEDVGYFCGMTVVDHPGPKGQIHLEQGGEPIWFSSVRDTLAYTLLPEESKRTAAIYVNDMAVVEDWHRPGPGTWIEAREAHYVVGSSARGGMGATEVVPFSDKAAAERFRDEHGGTVYGFSEIPEDYVLGPGGGPAGGQAAAGPGPEERHEVDGQEGEGDHGRH